MGTLQGKGLLRTLSAPDTHQREEIWVSLGLSACPDPPGEMKPCGWSEPQRAGVRVAFQGHTKDISVTPGCYQPATQGSHMTLGPTLCPQRKTQDSCTQEHKHRGWTPACQSHKVTRRTPPWARQEQGLLSDTPTAECPSCPAAASKLWGPTGSGAREN